MRAHCRRLPTVRSAVRSCGLFLVRPLRLGLGLVRVRVRTRVSFRVRVRLGSLLGLHTWPNA